MKKIILSLLLAASISTTLLIAQNENRQEGPEASAITTNCPNVTVHEYCDFLNAIATTNDLHHLGDRLEAVGYRMGGVEGESQSPILRTGFSGNYHYEIVPGCENLPMTNVNELDQVRYCNWLENGQPIGPQSEKTTEDGVYTLGGEKIIDVNSEATHRLKDGVKDDSEKSFNVNPQLMMDPLAIEEAGNTLTRGLHISEPNVSPLQTTSTHSNVFTIVQNHTVSSNAFSASSQHIDPDLKEQTQQAIEKVISSSSTQLQDHYKKADEAWSEYDCGWQKYSRIYHELQESCKQLTLSKQKLEQAIKATTSEELENTRLGKISKYAGTAGGMLGNFPEAHAQVASAGASVLGTFAGGLNTTLAQGRLYFAKKEHQEISEQHESNKKQKDKIRTTLSQCKQHAEKMENHGSSQAEQAARKLAEQLHPQTYWKESEYQGWGALVGSSWSDKDRFHLIDLVRHHPNLVEEVTKTVWQQKVETGKKEHMALQKKANLASLKHDYETAFQQHQRAQTKEGEQLTLLNKTQNSIENLKQEIEKQADEMVLLETQDKKQFEQKKEEFIKKLGELEKTQQRLQVLQKKWEEAVQRTTNQEEQRWIASETYQNAKKKAEKTLTRMKKAYRVDQEIFQRVWLKSATSDYKDWGLPENDISQITENTPDFVEDTITSEECQPPIQRLEEIEAQGRNLRLREAMMTSSTAVAKNSVVGTIQTPFSRQPSSLYPTQTNLDQVQEWALKKQENPSAQDQERWKIREELDQLKKEINAKKRELQQYDASIEEQMHSGNIVDAANDDAKSTISTATEQTVSSEASFASSSMTVSKSSVFSLGGVTVFKNSDHKKQAAPPLSTIRKETQEVKNSQELQIKQDKILQEQQEQLERQLRQAYNLKKEYFKLLNQAENERLSPLGQKEAISFSKEEDRNYAWEEADRKRIVLIQKKRREQELEEIAQQEQESWQTNTERWRLRAQADSAIKALKIAQAQVVKLGQEAIETKIDAQEAEIEKKKEAAEAQVKRLKQVKGVTEVEWEKRAQEYRDEHVGQSAVQEQSKEAQEQANERLKERDRAVNKRWEKLLEHYQNPELETIAVEQEESNIAMNLAMNLKKNLNQKFQESIHKNSGDREAALVHYRDLALKQVLIDACDYPEELKEAWEKVSVSTEGIDKDQQKINKDATEVFKKEVKRLEKIEKIWKGILETEQEEAKQKREQAVQEYYRGNPLDWNSLSEQERNRYNNEVKKTNEEYNQKIVEAKALIEAAQAEKVKIEAKRQRIKDQYITHAANKVVNVTLAMIGKPVEENELQKLKKQQNELQNTIDATSKQLSEQEEFLRIGKNARQNKNYYQVLTQAQNNEKTAKENKLRELMISQLQQLNENKIVLTIRVEALKNEIKKAQSQRETFLVQGKEKLLSQASEILSEIDQLITRTSVHDKMCHVQREEEYSKVSKSGLINGGNDCFINSSLQLLKALGLPSPATMPNLVRFLNDEVRTDKDCEKLRLEIANRVMSGKNEFQNVVNNINNPSLSSAYEQHDATEFISIILEKLNVPQVHFQNIITRVDNQVDQPKEVTESILALGLPEHEGITMQEIIDNYVQDQAPKENGDIIKEEKKLTEPVPQTLIVSIKRFGFDNITQAGTKRQDVVNGVLDTITLLLENGEQAIYQPNAIICHVNSDSINSGHYICYRKEGGAWWKFDDDHVTSATYEDDNENIKKNCYVISYKRSDTKHASEQEDSIIRRSRQFQEADKALQENAPTVGTLDEKKSFLQKCLQALDLKLSPQNQQHHLAIETQQALQSKIQQVLAKIDESAKQLLSCEVDAAEQVKTVLEEINKLEQSEQSFLQHLLQLGELAQKESDLKTRGEALKSEMAVSQLQSEPSLAQAQEKLLEEINNILEQTSEVVRRLLDEDQGASETISQRIKELTPRLDELLMRDECFQYNTLSLRDLKQKKNSLQQRLTTLSEEMNAFQDQGWPFIVKEQKKIANEITEMLLRIEKAMNQLRQEILGINHTFEQPGTMLLRIEKAMNQLSQGVLGINHTFEQPGTLLVEIEKLEQCVDSFRQHIERNREVVERFAADKERARAAERAEWTWQGWASAEVDRIIEDINTSWVKSELIRTQWMTILQESFNTGRTNIANKDKVVENICKNNDGIVIDAQEKAAKAAKAAKEAGEAVLAGNGSIANPVAEDLWRTSEYWTKAHEAQKASKTTLAVAWQEAAAAFQMVADQRKQLAEKGGAEYRSEGSLKSLQAKAGYQVKVAEAQEAEKTELAAAYREAAATSQRAADQWKQLAEKGGTEYRSEGSLKSLQAKADYQAKAGEAQEEGKTELAAVYREAVATSQRAADQQKQSNNTNLMKEGAITQAVADARAEEAEVRSKREALFLQEEATSIKKEADYQSKAAEARNARRLSFLGEGSLATAYREAAETSRLAAGQWQLSAQAKAQGQESEGTSLGFEGESLQKKADYQAKAAEAQEARKPTLAAEYSKAVEISQKAAEQWKLSAQAKAQGQESEGTSLGFEGESLQKKADYQAKAAEAQEVGKLTLAVEYSKAVETSHKAAEQWKLSAQAKAQGQESEGTSWGWSGKSFQSEADYQAKAAEAKAAYEAKVAETKAADRATRTKGTRRFAQEGPLETAYRKAAETSHKAAEQWKLSAKAKATGEESKGTSLGNVGSFLQKKGDYQAKEGEAREASKKELAEAYYKAAKTFELAADSEEAANKPELSDQTKLSLQKKADCQAKAAEAQEARKIELEGGYTEAAVTFQRAVDQHKLAVKTKAQGKDNEGISWSWAGESFQKTADYQAKAAEAEESGKKTLALGYREAAKTSQGAAEQQELSAEKYAAGKESEGNSWGWEGRSLQLKADYQIKAIEAQEVGKTTLVPGYREAAETSQRAADRYKQSAQARAAWKSNEALRLFNEAQAIQARANELAKQAGEFQAFEAEIEKAKADRITVEVKRLQVEARAKVTGITDQIEQAKQASMKERGVENAYVWDCIATKLEQARDNWNKTGETLVQGKQEKSSLWRKVAVQSEASAESMRGAINTYIDKKVWSAYYSSDVSTWSLKSEEALEKVNQVPSKDRDFWRNLAEQYKVAVDYEEKASEAHLADKVDERNSCTWIGRFTHSSADRQLKAMEAQEAGKTTLATTYREAAETSQLAAEQWKQSIETKVAGKNNESVSWGERGLSLQRQADYGVKAAEAEEARKTTLAAAYREAAVTSQRAADQWELSAEIHVAGKNDEGNMWGDEGKSLQSKADCQAKAGEAQEAGERKLAEDYRKAVARLQQDADQHQRLAQTQAAREENRKVNRRNEIVSSSKKYDYREKAIRAEQAGKKTLAAAYDEASTISQRAADQQTLSANTFADGKQSEGVSWEKEGLSIQSKADYQVKAAEAEENHKTTLAAAYREAASTSQLAAAKHKESAETKAQGQMNEGISREWEGRSLQSQADYQAKAGEAQEAGEKELAAAYHKAAEISQLAANQYKECAANNLRLDTNLFHAAKVTQGKAEAIARKAETIAKKAEGYLTWLSKFKF